MTRKHGPSQKQFGLGPQDHVQPDGSTGPDAFPGTSGENKFQDEVDEAADVQAIVQDSIEADTSYRGFWKEHRDNVFYSPVVADTDALIAGYDIGALPNFTHDILTPLTQPDVCRQLTITTSHPYNSFDYLLVYVQGKRYGKPANAARFMQAPFAPAGTSVFVGAFDEVHLIDVVQSRFAPVPGSTINIGFNDVLGLDVDRSYPFGGNYAPVNAPNLPGVQIKTPDTVINAVGINEGDVDYMNQGSPTIENWNLTYASPAVNFNGLVDVSATGYPVDGVRSFNFGYTVYYYAGIRRLFS